MSIYRDEDHAVRRAMSVDLLAAPTPPAWQKHHRPGFVEHESARPTSGPGMSRNEMHTQDCMTRALIHDALTRRQWLVMTALYAVHDNERISACEELVRLVETPADALFRCMVVGAWAFPHEAKRVGLGEITLQDVPERTVRRWRKDIRDQLDGWRKDALTHLSRVLDDAGLLITEAMA
jgi:hypothetical protein